MKYLFFALFIMLTSCYEEETIYGCTDLSSINYNPLAEINDGTCLYTADAVIWYGQSVSAFLQSNGITSLRFYVDGNLIGSSASNVFWTGQPTCNQNGSITVFKDLESSSSGFANYSVLDQFGNSYWSGTLMFNGGRCSALQLTL